MKRALVVGLTCAACLLSWWLSTRGTLDGGDSLKRPNVASLFVHLSMSTPLVAFKNDLGRFPTTAEGLAALLRCPPGLEGRWQGPYLEELPLDPWGHPYQYRSPATKSTKGYDLWSFGPDGVASDDDIGNWL